MKRPPQHIIEEESRTAFANIIPSSWVKNDFLKDYGKDIHVEIFSQFQSTGNTFIVQLKATQNNIKNDTISINISIDIFKYYASLNHAVLLVLYSTKTKQFRGIWANRLLEELNRSEKQKTITIALGTGNKIDAQYFSRLEKTFSPEIPFRLNLHIDHQGELAELMANRLKGWCSLYFPGFFSLNDETIPFKVRVSLTDENNELAITVTGKNGKADLEKIPAVDCLFLYSKLLLENEIDKHEQELLFVISNYFSEYNPAAVLRIFTTILHEYAGKYKTPLSLQAIAEYTLENNLKHELQQLIENSIKAKLSSDFQILNAILLREKDLLDNYISNLLLAYQEFPQSALKGSLAYNAGNFYRFRRNNYSAVKYYMLAKKHHPEYLMKHYWWNELAGILFTAGHDLFAEKFYRKAILLDAEKEKMPFTLALLADCLFYQGKFAEAYTFFNEFCKQIINDKNKLPSAEYSFKGMECLYLTQEGYDNVPFDKAGSKKQYFSGVADNNKSSFEKSITLYPLNYYSWQRLGDYYRKENENIRAYHAYLITALLMGKDRKAWIDCLIAAHHLEKPEISVPVFFLIIEQLGNVSLNEVIISIQQMPDISLDDKKSIAEEFTQLFNTYKKSIEPDTYKPPFTEYRML